MADARLHRSERTRRAEPPVAQSCLSQKAFRAPCLEVNIIQMAGPVDNLLSSSKRILAQTYVRTRVSSPVCMHKQVAMANTPWQEDQMLELLAMPALVIRRLAASQTRFRATPLVKLSGQRFCKLWSTSIQLRHPRLNVIIDGQIIPAASVYYCEHVRFAHEQASIAVYTKTWSPPGAYGATYRA